jgi:hypothetical protein
MIEKQNKERRFLKTLGKIGEILLQEVLIKIGSSLIKRIGGKKTLPSILFLFISICLFAQYPATGNKQRLGYQTTGDGLVYRGRALDTMTIKSSGLNNAYFILDTLNNILYNYIKTKGGWKFSNGDTIIIQGVTMPFDSITFNTANDGTVGIGEVEYNDTQGSLIQGLKGGLVTNVIGQQLHQRVNNRTGATLTKGTAVYLSGSQGNRITVAKALGVTDAFSANTFGIIAESIANNQSGYVITEGLITNINTSALVEDSAVYLSPTVAGGLTSTKPQAPQHTVYIGVCVKSNAGSGELFVKIRNGQEIDELHDVKISNPSNNASLYYKLNEKLWRDTTAALLVSDTAMMLTTYFKKSDTTSLNLVSRFAAKQNILNGTGFVKTSGTSITYDNSTYLTTSSAASTYLPLSGGTVTGNTSFTQRLTVGSSTNYDVFNVHHTSEDGIRMTYQSEPTSYYLQIRPKVTPSNVRYVFSQANLNVFYDSVLVFNNGNVAINKLNPAYKLDINGTFGVTGATTLSSTLAVTGNITEAGNNVMTNLDTVSLSSRINGKVSLNGDETINGTKSFNNIVNVLNRMTLSGSVSGLNKLLGKNTDGNGVGDITVGSGLNLAANTLTAPVIDTASMLDPYWRSGRFSGTLPIANGGTGATSESNARTNLKVDYLFIATNAGAGVAVTTNRVFIVNSGGFSTTTLDLTTLASGNTYMIKNLASGTVVSSANNVIPLNGGSASTPILSAGNVTPQWCTLVCDGTNWHIVQKN